MDKNRATRKRGKGCKASKMWEKAGMKLQGRIFIARHGETVFNARAIMQGQQALHTPLTSRGFAQATEMGRSLATWLGTRQALSLWSSTAGRALQTLAIVAEHIGADWHTTRADERLQEIDVGTWSGRSYDEIASEIGPFIDHEAGLFTVRAPEGEGYDDVAARLSSWIAETAGERGDRLILMHGMSARVLRGLLLDLPVDPRFGAPIAPSLPQGTMVLIGNGEERIVAQGKGSHQA
jgi:glucosyl-3-phosphoglycerate phosphatase